MRRNTTQKIFVQGIQFLKPISQNFVSFLHEKKRIFDFCTKFHGTRKFGFPSMVLLTSSERVHQWRLGDSLLGHHRFGFGHLGATDCKVRVNSVCTKVIDCTTLYLPNLLSFLLNRPNSYQSAYSKKKSMHIDCP